jgi:hypothetical protein
MVTTGICQCQSTNTCVREYGVGAESRGDVPLPERRAKGDERDGEETEHENETDQPRFGERFEVEAVRVESGGSVALALPCCGERAGSGTGEWVVTHEEPCDPPVGSTYSETLQRMGAGERANQPRSKHREATGQCVRQPDIPGSVARRTARGARPQGRRLPPRPGHCVDRRAWAARTDCARR